MIRNESHPTGVRGLKFVIAASVQAYRRVAPHWGAWIEIRQVFPCVDDVIVAPHWGAWIEMNT